MTNKTQDEYLKEIKNLIDLWFYSDFDIALDIRKGKNETLMTLESDAWYDHQNNHTRHEGNKRRIYLNGDDELDDELSKKFDLRDKTEEELLNFLDELVSYGYRVLPDYKISNRIMEKLRA